MDYEEEKWTNWPEFENRQKFEGSYDSIKHLDPRHDRLIENLNLHKNIEKACQKHDIEYLTDLFNYNHKEISEWHGIGPKLSNKISTIKKQWSEAQNEEVTHIIMLSGGAGSWYTGKRVIERYGTENTMAIFADTSMEDKDTYKFLKECVKELGIEDSFKKVRDGRTPWDIFFDEKFIGNSRVDVCSRILKREAISEWLNENFNPFNCVCYLGIDWTERHRIEDTSPKKLPWVYKAPLVHSPHVMKEQMLQRAKEAGLPTQRLYSMGFPHANCGGFCVRAGQAHFQHLYKKMPERYKFHEEKEQEFREKYDKDVTVLRKTIDGEEQNITLKKLREDYIEGDEGEIDEKEWGGCGCFSSV